MPLHKYRENVPNEQLRKLTDHYTETVYLSNLNKVPIQKYILYDTP